MALSEHDQRMLDEIEESLTRNDPRLGTELQFSHKHKRLGGLSGLIALAVGLGLVFLGVVTASGVGLIMAVTGFVVTVIGSDGCIAGIGRVCSRYLPFETQSRVEPRGN